MAGRLSRAPRARRAWLGHVRTRAGAFGNRPHGAVVTGGPPGGRRARRARAVAVVGCLLVLSACGGRAAWVRETIAARHHVADRHDAPHRTAVLDTGRDALLFRVERIREAKQSIRLQTFILTDSSTTRLLMHELVRAARRGVRVQVLADQMFSESQVELVARTAVAHPGLELRAYNPPSDALAPGTLAAMGLAVADFGRVNHRMHNKLLVVDDTWGLCGGRNHQDSYFDEDPSSNYRDRDVAVTGPVVADMAASFDEYWTDPASVDVRRLVDVAATVARLPADERGWPFSLEALGVEALSSRLTAHASSGGLPLDWHAVEHVAFWADRPGKPPIDEDAQSVALRLVGAVGDAREEILIQTPYLVLSDAGLELFRQVRQRGVPIRVHTNSLASTDNLAAYAHALQQRHEMIESLDLEIFELEPRPGHLRDIVPGYDGLVARSEASRPAGGGGPTLSLHAKSMVIDDRLALIGSYNLDPRSEALNTELVLAIWDEAFSAELGGAIRRDARPGNSWVVAPRERWLVRRIAVDVVERVNRVVQSTTTLDLWPIEWCSLYALRPGAEPVSRFHAAFHERYRPVGPFPGVEGSLEMVLLQLARGLTGVLRPLI